MFSLSFKEWFLLEMMSRKAAMTHEDIPESVPTPGSTIIFFDKPESTRLTNDDIYGVMSNDGDFLKLVKFRDIFNPKKSTINYADIQAGPSIPRQYWKQLQIVNHLLNTKEKRSDWARSVVWGYGPYLEKWIKNRTTHEPAVQPTNQITKAAAKQFLMGDPTEKATNDDALAKARASLFGDEPAVPQGKTPEQLAQRLKAQWRLGR